MDQCLDITNRTTIWHIQWPRLFWVELLSLYINFLATSTSLLLGVSAKAKERRDRNIS